MILIFKVIVTGITHDEACFLAPLAVPLAALVGAAAVPLMMYACIPPLPTAVTLAVEWYKGTPSLTELKAENAKARSDKPIGWYRYSSREQSASSRKRACP
jgi:hypothetical protein